MRRIDDFMETAGLRDDVCYSSAHLWVDFQTERRNHNSWTHGMVQKAEVEKSEHDIISLEVFCCSPKNCPLFGIRHQRHMLTMSDKRIYKYCKDKVIEKGQKDNTLMSYGCVPILFVCFPVLHAASHWLMNTISQRCKWGKAGQKNRRCTALWKSVSLVS